MKKIENKKIITFFLVLVLLLIPIWVKAVDSGGDRVVSVDQKTTQNGISVEIKSLVEMKYLRIYRIIDDGRFILFYKSNGENAKERTVYFSRNLLPDKVRLKVVVVDKDGKQYEGDLEEIEIPVMPSINPSETAKPSWSESPIPTKPTPSTSAQPSSSGEQPEPPTSAANPSSEPKPQPSPSPATPSDKETITYNGKKYTVPAGDKVYFLDVQDKNGSKYQGSDCILICSQGKYGLIDATLESKASRVIKHLKELGVTELEFIFATHSHSDHVGGYKKIIDKIPTKKVYVKGSDKNYKERIITPSKNKGIQVVTGANLTAFTLGNFKFKIYSTKIYKVSNDNVNTLTCVATVQGKKIYFAGDIQNDKSKKQYPERETAQAIKKVDVYKVGHHCYGGSNAVNNSQKAIDALKPSYAVVTNHKNRSGTESASKIIKKYTKDKNFYWAGNGTVLLNIDSSGNLKYKQFSEEK